MKLKTKTTKIVLTRVDEDELWKTIGSKVEAKRKQAGVTQVDLAKQLLVTRTTVTNLESGRQHTPLETLYNIAIILGCDVVDLLP